MCPYVNHTLLLFYLNWRLVKFRNSCWPPSIPCARRPFNQHMATVCRVNWLGINPVNWYYVKQVVLTPALLMNQKILMMNGTVQSMTEMCEYLVACVSVVSGLVENRIYPRVSHGKSLTYLASHNNVADWPCFFYHFCSNLLLYVQLKIL